jgi:hypothetical protein
MKKELSAHQQKVLAAFTRKDTDIDIVVLYMRVYDFPKHYPSVREMQQKLAPTFKQINDKLYADKGAYLLIEPGNIKRTYRLSNIRG